MDMVPAGPMLILLNDDRPGMVGLVGSELGNAQVNIADMSISRRDSTAMMVLKIDDPVPASLMDHLKTRPGILKVAMVNLPDE
jgi:D-3-phosphoglycerate dehydrogenase